MGSFGRLRELTPRGKSGLVLNVVGGWGRVLMTFFVDCNTKVVPGRMII